MRKRPRWTLLLPPYNPPKGQYLHLSSEIFFRVVPDPSGKWPLTLLCRDVGSRRPCRKRLGFRRNSFWTKTLRHPVPKTHFRNQSPKKRANTPVYETSLPAYEPLSVVGSAGPLLASCWSRSSRRPCWFRFCVCRRTPPFLSLLARPRALPDSRPRNFSEIRQNPL